MATESLKHVIDAVSDEKGIEPKVLIEAIEQAILTAAKRQFGSERELEATYNPARGQVELKMYMEVVDEIDFDDKEILLDDARRYGLEADLGDQLGFDVFYLEEDTGKARDQDRAYGPLLGIEQARRGFGRIAAQTAKQVIMQRIREAERDRVYDEFQSKKGELISGTVRRFERGANIIVELDRLGDGQQRTVEAVLPPKEQTPRESYRPGERIIALLKDIDREARGPQIILSRTSDQMLVKLFEKEVPEIYEGTVRIVAAVRDPGARSKIAVSSRESDVDPVGACVGMKGARVQAVVQELRGEKIDIVPFDKDAARFVCNAIAPAEVARVVIDEGNSTMELVVPDDKQSLAIGRRGQNVKLASRLTGWKLEIISESEFAAMETSAMELLYRVASSEDIARNLYRMGFRTIDEVVEATSDELLTVDGIRESNVEAIRAQAVQAQEDHRQERLRTLAASGVMPSERERLGLVRGLSERMMTILEKGGYGSVGALLRETDLDRLAVRTRLPHEVASEIHAEVARFVEEEWPSVETALHNNREQAPQHMQQSE